MSGDRLGFPVLTPLVSSSSPNDGWAGRRALWSAISTPLLADLVNKFRTSYIAGCSGVCTIIDTITYGLTQNLPGGPIIRPDPDWPPALYNDTPDIEEDDRPASRAQIIATTVSVAAIVGVVGYIFLAL